MYSVGDIINVLWPDKPLIGSTVRGSITLKEYQRNPEGWEYLYVKSYDPLTWERLLLKERRLSPPSVRPAPRSTFASSVRHTPTWPPQNLHNIR